MPHFAVDVRSSLTDRPRRIYLSGDSARAASEEASSQGLIVESVHACAPSDLPAAASPAKADPAPAPAPLAAPLPAPAAAVPDRDKMPRWVKRLLFWIIAFFVVVSLMRGFNAAFDRQDRIMMSP